MAPASIACTRQWSSAGRGPSGRPGRASITPIMCRGLPRRRLRQLNRLPRRGPENPPVATIQIIRFAWKPMAWTAAASNASSRPWSSAGSAPAARPGRASTIRLTLRHRRTLPRHQPRLRRRPNQPSQPNPRSRRNQQNRLSRLPHCDLRNCSSTARSRRSLRKTMPACQAARLSLTPLSIPASISASRMRAISALEILTKGGRTTARGSLPSSTSASFIRLCMSTNGSA